MSSSTPVPVARVRAVFTRFALTFALVTAGSLARADSLSLDGPSETDADTSAPTIAVALPPQARPGAFTLRAQVSDASRVLVATLYWRPSGAQDWRLLVMEPTGAVFSATLAVSDDVELWVEAFDELGNGPGLAGSATEPLVLKVVDPKAAAAPRPRPAKVEPPPEPPKPKAPAQPMTSASVVRVATARGLVRGRGEFSLTAGAFAGSDVLVPGATLRGGTGDVRVSWAPLSFAEFVVGASGRGASLASASGRIDTARGVGDPFLAARFVSPSFAGLRLAGVLSLDVPLPDWADARAAVSPGVLLAATYERPRLRASLNAGYRWDNAQNAFPGRVGAFGALAMGVSAFDQLRLGAALEFPLSVFVPFVEYSADVPIERRHFAACDAAECRTPPALVPVPLAAIPQRVGGGVRLELGETVALVVAAERGLSQAGVELSRTDVRSVPAPDGLVVAPPWSGHVSLRVQFGAPLPSSVPGDPASQPSGTAASPSESSGPALSTAESPSESSGQAPSTSVSPAESSGQSLSTAESPSEPSVTPSATSESAPEPAGAPAAVPEPVPDASGGESDPASASSVPPASPPTAPSPSEPTP